MLMSHTALLYLCNTARLVGNARLVLIGFNYACMPAFTKECKLCSHMNHFNSPKCKQCHAQLAIGGKPTAKVGLRKVRSVKCVEI